MSVLIKLTYSKREGLTSTDKKVEELSQWITDSGTPYLRVRVSDLLVVKFSTRCIGYSFQSETYEGEVYFSVPKSTKKYKFSFSNRPDGSQERYSVVQRNLGKGNYSVVVTKEI